MYSVPFMYPLHMQYYLLPQISTGLRQTRANGHFFCIDLGPRFIPTTLSNLDGICVIN